ncbi:hypothetical protein QUC31_011757 [Theobroma cacao]
MESHGVNAVLVDEEAVGLVDETGCGAYILYGDGELDRFLAKRTLKHFVVCPPDVPSLYLMSNFECLFIINLSCLY